MSLSESVSSLLLIIRAVSNSIIHTQKSHAVLSSLLPPLTLRPKAGRVSQRRWEKAPPAVKQICLFTSEKVQNNDIFFLVISVATVMLLQISAPDNRCIHFMTLWKYRTRSTYT